MDNLIIITQFEISLELLTILKPKRNYKPVGYIKLNSKLSTKYRGLRERFCTNIPAWRHQPLHTLSAYYCVLLSSSVIIYTLLVFFFTIFSVYDSMLESVISFVKSWFTVQLLLVASMCGAGGEWMLLLYVLQVRLRLFCRCRNLLGVLAGVQEMFHDVAVKMVQKAKANTDSGLRVYSPDVSLRHMLNLQF